MEGRLIEVVVASAAEGVETASRDREKRGAMTEEMSAVSKAFRLFVDGAPKHASAWMGAVQGLDAASALDKKTVHLAYLAVLAGLRLESGVPFHVKLAKAAGASRDEVISAVLVGLPAAGIGVTAALPAAIDAYDFE